MMKELRWEQMEPTWTWFYQPNDSAFYIRYYFNSLLSVWAKQRWKIKSSFTFHIPTSPEENKETDSSYSAHLFYHEHCLFRVLLVCLSWQIFPLKKCSYVGRILMDPASFFCSSGQVWGDNSQVCAAERDDYRIYCLSEAQSTLIQQFHLYLIYESLSLFLSFSFLTVSVLSARYALGFLFSAVFLSRPCVLTVA